VSKIIAGNLDNVKIFLPSTMELWPTVIFLNRPYATRQQNDVRSAAHKFERYMDIRATPAIIAYSVVDAVDAGTDNLSIE
jgi:hypothetical protein